MKKSSLKWVCTVLPCLALTVLLAGCGLFSSKKSEPAEAVAAVSRTGSGIHFPVENKAKIVNVNVETLNKPAELKYKLVVDDVPEAYREAITFYTVNGLRYLGYKEDPNADIVIRISLQITEPRSGKGRYRVQYSMIAEKDNSMMWTIRSSCTGGLKKKAEMQYWFPGLVASCLPYYGENGHKLHNVNKHRQYLTAVSTGVRQ